MPIPFKSPRLNGLPSTPGMVQTFITYDLSNESISNGNQTISEEINNQNQNVFIGIFEKTGIETSYTEENPTADGRSNPTWYNPELPVPQNIEGNYTNMTTNMRVIDENLKICPSNMKDGCWDKDNNKFYWISSKPVYPIITRNEGWLMSQLYEDYSDLNWCAGIMDTLHQIILDGLLIYPYGPAILSHYDEGTHDEYGQYFKDKYDDEHPFYHKEGKILGNTGSTTTGMVFVESE